MLLARISIRTQRPFTTPCTPGSLDAVKVLVEGGASLDVKDTIYEGTPLGWAEYGEQAEIAAFLRERGAR